MCEHFGLIPWSLPTSLSNIYKEECTLCFDGPLTTGGIDVCLTCFSGSCSCTHSVVHYQKFKHPFVVNIQKTIVQKCEKITKVAIGLPGGVSNIEYDVITSVKCFRCDENHGKEVDISSFTPAQSLVKAILSHASAAKQAELRAWEEEIIPCEHSLMLGECIPKNIDTAQSQGTRTCDGCPLTSNLWMCLTCGNIGCGRRQYDGSGGNDHAMNHYQSTKHPLSVKLGTITPEGTADVYCYLCDDIRIDPYLSDHLKLFGISVDVQLKYEKNVAELQLDQNMKFDFSMTTDDGQQLLPLSGSGFVGLCNLGNTCYLSSVLQCVFQLNAFRHHYLSSHHPSQCMDPSPAQCFMCQMCKIAHRLYFDQDKKEYKKIHGKYQHPNNNLCDSIPKDNRVDTNCKETPPAPGMLKVILGKQYPEFATMRQQDAYECFEHLSRLIELKERKTGQVPSDCFKFLTRQRLQCLQCRRVRYRTFPSMSLSLDVSDQLQDSLLLFTTPETVEFHCPHCQSVTTAEKSMTFASYPEVLVLHIRRFVYEGMVPRKVLTPMAIPEVIHLEDYTQRPGKTADHRRKRPLDGDENHPLVRGNEHLEEEEEEIEILMEEESDMNQNTPVNKKASTELGQHQETSSSAQSKDVEVPIEWVTELMLMGFEETKVREAFVKTNCQSAEIAMSYLLGDIPAMTESGDGKKVDQFVSEGNEETILTLTEMGFSYEHSKRALKETQWNTERAIEWLFSHPEEVLEEAHSSEERRISLTLSDLGIDARASAQHLYKVASFISHKGPSVHCGHYVSYLEHKDDDKNEGFALFNDDRVVKVKDREGIEDAYIYFLRRIPEK